MWCIQMYNKYKFDREFWMGVSPMCIFILGSFFVPILFSVNSALGSVDFNYLTTPNSSAYQGSLIINVLKYMFYSQISEIIKLLLWIIYYS